MSIINKTIIHSTGIEPYLIFGRVLHRLNRSLTNLACRDSVRRHILSLARPKFEKKPGNSSRFLLLLLLLLSNFELTTPLRDKTSSRSSKLSSINRVNERVKTRLYK